VTIENSEKFIAEEYDPAKLIAGESFLTWRQFSNTHRQRFNKEIQRNKVITHDSFLNLGQS
jgi:hypothetical protein